MSARVWSWFRGGRKSSKYSIYIYVHSNFNQLFKFLWQLKIPWTLAKSWEWIFLHPCTSVRESSHSHVSSLFCREIGPQPVQVVLIFHPPPSHMIKLTNRMQHLHSQDFLHDFCLEVWNVLRISEFKLHYQEEIQQQLKFQEVIRLYQLFTESSWYITSSVLERIQFMVTYGWGAFNCCFLPDDWKTPWQVILKFHRQHVARRWDDLMFSNSDRFPCWSVRSRTMYLIIPPHPFPSRLKWFELASCWNAALKLAHYRLCKLFCLVDIVVFFEPLMHLLSNYQDLWGYAGVYLETFIT